MLRNNSITLNKPHLPLYMVENLLCKSCPNFLRYLIAKLKLQFEHFGTWSSMPSFPTLVPCIGMHGTCAGKPRMEKSLNQKMRVGKATQRGQKTESLRRERWISMLETCWGVVMRYFGAELKTEKKNLIFE